MCINIFGVYKCVCKVGYMGDGRICLGKNVCLFVCLYVFICMFISLFYFDEVIIIRV